MLRALGSLWSDTTSLNLILLKPDLIEQPFLVTVSVRKLSSLP